MVKLSCSSLKRSSTSQQIKKALDRLCQRYGIFEGFTSEAKDKAICYDPKVSFNLNSLRLFDEDLNLLKMFAYTHKMAKLSGQLFLDTANRLPHTAALNWWTPICIIPFGVFNADPILFLKLATYAVFMQ